MPRNTELSPGELWDVAEEPDFTRSPRDVEVEREGAEVDSVRLYFQQIARVPLLKPREERALCEQIEAAQQAVAAALLGVPAAARRLAELTAAVRSGASMADGLLQSAEGSPLSRPDIAAALTGLARARRKAASGKGRAN